MRLEGPYKRSEKRFIRTKGSLRCQWCFRWTEILPGYDWGSVIILKQDAEHKKKYPKPKVGDPVSSFRCWEEYAEAHKDHFFCKREACAASKREAM